MNILFAEDDIRLGKLVVHMLKKEHFTVDWVMNGEDAYDYALTTPYNIIIMDWMMPKIDGITVCNMLRKQQYQGAILMLTAKDTIDNKVQGLDSGADDYLVKPFEFKELFARLRALIRRNPHTVLEDILQAGDITFDRANHSVKQNHTEIQLTTREYQLLELLMINQGQTIPREMILERVWGLDHEITSNTLDAYIRLLRKKIGDNKSEKIIKNIRGVGYRFETGSV